MYFLDNAHKVVAKDIAIDNLLRAMEMINNQVSQAQ
jgi:hypothetical protein